MSDWLSRIRLHLRLSGDAGVLVLIDEADPRRLRELCLALLPAAPDLEVYTEPAELLDAPPGETAILVARAEHAPFLQLHRPRFESQRRKVIVFSDAATTRALSLAAPDFMDWMSLRVSCPEGVAMFAVHGIRAAAQARAPISWESDGVDLSGCSRAFGHALPNTPLVWWDSGWSDSLKSVRACAGKWIGVFSTSGYALGYFEAVLRRAHHGRCAVFISPRLAGVRVDDRSLSPPSARVMLRDSGVVRAGLMAALLDMEPEAVQLARDLRACEAALLRQLRWSCDPGLVLAMLASPAIAGTDTLMFGGPASRLAVSQGARWPATRASHRQAARSPEEVVAHANHESPDGTIGAIDHELVFHDADVLVFLPSLARALAATGATVPAERLLGHALGSPIELAREAALFEVPGVHASFVLRDFLASPPPSLTPALRAEIARTLADIFLAQGRYAEAEQLLHDAVACFGPGDPAASRARAELAWAYALQDRLPQALDAARTALELGARASDVEAAYARITHALILARGGDRSGAADASAALATLEAQRGRDDETVVNLRRRVTSLLIDAG